MLLTQPKGLTMKIWVKWKLVFRFRSLNSMRGTGPWTFPKIQNEKGRLFRQNNQNWHEDQTFRDQQWRLRWWPEWLITSWMPMNPEHGGNMQKLKTLHLELNNFWHNNGDSMIRHLIWLHWDSLRRVFKRLSIRVIGGQAPLILRFLRVWLDRWNHVNFCSKHVIWCNMCASSEGLFLVMSSKPSQNQQVTKRNAA